MVKRRKTMLHPDIKKTQQYKPVAKDPARPKLSFPSMEKKKIVPGLTWPSMQPILTEREKAEQARISDILHPDTSRRLRYPSMGDPPREKPKRSDFKGEQHWKAALNHWHAEQKAEQDIYRNSLR
jgi:hypothetical protein